MRIFAGKRIDVHDNQMDIKKRCVDSASYEFLYGPCSRV